MSRITRAERLAQITALQAEGLTRAEVAARLGTTYRAVAGILEDPDGSRQRARRTHYQGVCERCGAPTDGSNGKSSAPTICKACAPEVYGPQYSAAKSGQGPVQAAVLAALRAGPMRFMEISRAIGKPHEYMGQLLQRLVAQGLIERPSRGVYRLPERTDG